jgi:SHS2 domain-containing protein
MAYEFLPELATADIVFRATGSSLEQCFCDSVEALLAVMVNNPEQVQSTQEQQVRLQAPELDLLLFDLLQECVYLKDVKRLLLHCRAVTIEQRDQLWHATARLAGEPLDPKRHQQRADVKGVTLHQFSLKQIGGSWQAQVILDI